MTIIEDIKEKIMKIGNLKTEEMAEAGLHFGHRTSKVHPKMKPYIEGVRNTIHILNLEKTKEEFEKTLKYLQETVSEGKLVLFVGTKIQFKQIIKDAAEEMGMPYIAGRWLGGTFTNFNTLKKRIEYFKELESKKSKGELEKYTKKERADMDKELKDLEIKFGGVKNMAGLPEAIFVLDMKKDFLAIKEAKTKGVKVIGIADTNADPSLADYIIPANDDAISSVRFILDKVKEAVVKSKK